MCKMCSESEASQDKSATQELSVDNDKSGGAESAYRLPSLSLLDKPAPNVMVEEENDADEQLVRQALESIIKTQQCSVSFLQCELKIGYSRTRRILSILEKKGYVGPQEGTMPRRILCTTVPDDAFNSISLKEEENDAEEDRDKDGDDGGELGGDELLARQALEAIISAQQSSVSFLQTELKIGYSQARRILSMLEKKGYVGPQEGAMPRRILCTAVPDDAFL